MAKKTRQTSARQKGGRNRTVLLASSLAVLIAAGFVGYSYLNEPTTVRATATYAPEDVVRVRPFRAIHEMGSGPRIPFLPADQPQPRIVVTERVHDFGTIGPRDVVMQTFVIRNGGQGPLTISRAYTTCGCTTADITARVIPPGKVALVKLKFDAGFHDTRGQTVKRGLIIENNDRRQSKAEIWTRASVRRN